MCLIVFAWDIHPKYKLILAANRDEYYQRPTAQAAYWEDHQDIYGGRDLLAGGTWMAITRQGRFAAVTNYRDPENIKPDATSRGEIPVNFLTSPSTSVSSYIEHLHKHLGDYNGFNALVGDYNELAHYSNYERKYNKIDRGIHGLSNALLDTSWPKVERAKMKFKETIDHNFDHADLLGLMADTSIADDAILPRTGVPYEWEKALSAICIQTENYGTCSTSVVTLDRLGRLDFTERSYRLAGTPTLHISCKVEV